MLTAYRMHPATKSLAPIGSLCSRHTTGLLLRRPVEMLSIAHSGKEANLLEEIAAGLISDEKDLLLEYSDTNHTQWTQLVLLVLRTLPVRATAEAAGLSTAGIKKLRAGATRPHRETEARLTAIAVAQARVELSAGGRHSAAVGPRLPRAAPRYFTRPIVPV